jgi:predicted nucleic acid-binding protein
MKQMSGKTCFLDSNILIYLFSADAAKADRAERLIRHGGVISVQVLNECASVLRRKLASAQMAGCDTLYSEDMQHEQVITSSLRIIDPFVHPC